MPATNPGVKVLIKDGYTLPANSAPYAERIVIIAKHAATGASADVGDVLYSPVAYTSVADVDAMYGADSDASAAFNQVHQAGGANIFVVGCASTPEAVPAGETNNFSTEEYQIVKALEHVDAVQPDMIVVMGFELNKKYTVNSVERVSKAGKVLVDKCNELGADGFPCFAIAHAAAPTGTDALTSLVEVQSWIDTTVGVTANATGYDDTDAVIATLGADADGEDLGKYLVIVAGEVEMVNGNHGFKPAVGAVAGSVYVNGLESAITMQKIRGVKNVRYNFSKTQRTQLLGKFIMPVSLDTRGYAVTVDGITCAQPDVDDNESMYARLSTVRLAFEIIKSSRRVVEPVIGKPASTYVFNSIQTMLSSYYGSLKSAGLVSDLGFNFEYLASEYKLVIDIKLVPSGEIRTVELRLGVSMR